MAKHSKKKLSFLTGKDYETLQIHTNRNKRLKSRKRNKLAKYSRAVNARKGS